MGRVVFARGRLPAIALLFCATAIAMSAMASPAEAARRRKHSGGFQPPYAAMVVDAKSGRVLHAVNEDALRHPASVTKVMTLYLLFEQLEQGRLHMNTPLRVSAHAAAQAPSKIGFDPGDTIEVEDAAKALITKSANDVAAAIGENIAGSEEAFAAMMTRKARALGMSRTVFKNASGLPDPEQVTTARDLTILARAIQERFPRYYPMFGTRNFNYAGSNYRNHNKLLGRVEGVDGIKTGYTRASGFNLMTSARSEGRHIVSVVLGGRSGASRDQIMANLVATYMQRATPGGRTASVIAEARGEQAPPAAVQASAPSAAPSGRALAFAALPSEAPARTEPSARIEPPARVETVQTAPQPPARPQATRGTRPLELSALRATATSTSPFASRWSIGAQPAVIAPTGRVLRPPANVDTTSSIAKAAPAAFRSLDDAAEKQTVAKAEAVKPVEAAKIAAADAGKPHQAHSSGGWVIQLGATDDESKAQTILSMARSKAKSLSEASGFTEKVEKGGSTLFRARFAGFDGSKDANDTCSQLKRSGFSCFATRG